MKSKKLVCMLSLLLAAGMIAACKPAEGGESSQEKESSVISEVSSNEESKPSSAESKPSSAESKPSSAESKPSSASSQEGPTGEAVPFGGETDITPNKMFYWNDQNWVGSNVTVTKAEVLDGVYTFKYTSTGANKFGFQLFYRDSSLVQGQQYNVSFKLNVSSAVDNTGRSEADYLFKAGANNFPSLIAGDNELSYAITQGSGASLSLQFAAELAGSNEFTIVLSNLAFAEPQPEPEEPEVLDFLFLAAKGVNTPEVAGAELPSSISLRMPTSDSTGVNSASAIDEEITLSNGEKYTLTGGLKDFKGYNNWLSQNDLVKFSVPAGANVTIYFSHATVDKGWKVYKEPTEENYDKETMKLDAYKNGVTNISAKPTEAGEFLVTTFTINDAGNYLLCPAANNGILYAVEIYIPTVE